MEGNWFEEERLAEKVKEIYQQCVYNTNIEYISNTHTQLFYAIKKKKSINKRDKKKAPPCSNYVHRYCGIYNHNA
jgi:hypothetical protein